MERLKLFNQNFVQIAALNFDLIADSISSISYTDADGETNSVSDRAQITEFLENSDSSISKAIEEQISEINNIGINSEMQMECSNEKCLQDGKPLQFTSKVNFDPVNFFTAS